MAAARPRTLTAAIVPVVAAAAAAQRGGVFGWGPFFLTLTGGMAIQVAANFANDASDAKRGADPADRVGPPRMVALGLISERQMWRACWIAVGVAALAGLAMAFRVGPVILVIGVVSVVAMLGYVGGPFPYGYRGLGEVFVLLFFGLIAVAGSRLAYDGHAPGFVWWLGVPIGMLAAAILTANNLRDLPTDARTGKRSLAVIAGEVGARRIFFATMWGALLLTVLLAIAQQVPPGVTAGAAAGALIFPLHRLPLDPGDRRTYLPLLGGAVRVHLLFGTLLATGLLL